MADIGNPKPNKDKNHRSPGGFEVQSFGLWGSNFVRDGLEAVGLVLPNLKALGFRV